MLLDIKKRELIIDGNLSSITGTIRINGNLIVSQDVTGNINQVSAGDQLFEGNLTTQKTMTCNNLIVNGNVFSDLKLSNITIYGNILSDVRITRDLTVSNVVAYGNVTSPAIITTNVITGSITSINVTVSRDLTVSNVVASGNITIGRDLTVSNVVASGTVTANTVGTSGNITVGRDLTVSNVNIGRDLNVSGNIIVSTKISTYNLSVYNEIDTQSNITSSATIIASNALVSGNITVGTVTANTVGTSGNITVGRDLTVSNVVASGTVTANTVGTSGNITVGRDLTVSNVVASGTVTANTMGTSGNITVGRDLTVSNVFASGNVRASNLYINGNVAQIVQPFYFRYYMNNFVSNTTVALPASANTFLRSTIISLSNLVANAATTNWGGTTEGSVVSRTNGNITIPYKGIYNIMYSFGANVAPTAISLVSNTSIYGRNSNIIVERGLTGDTLQHLPFTGVFNAGDIITPTFTPSGTTQLIISGDSFFMCTLLTPLP